MSAPNDIITTNMNGTSHTDMMTNGLVAPSGLHSKAQDELLNMVDSLRFEGLDKDLSLPQLVVCGDQSSGKSSVLEAIAEIPFPRKENLCTRFATEIILRRKKAPSMTVKIVPDLGRTTDEQDVLSNHNITIHHIGELPTIIERATKVMGLEETAEGKGAFAKDVLRIEIAGPDQPHLTLVDLPGLIHSENRLQTATDVEVIGKLVEKYIGNPRTIILAVISAKNDYANQIILKKAREADPDGRRTLGIVTKPDDLYPGSDNEKAFINLAKNGDVNFALGWHVLRNRNAQETKLSFSERERKEEQFFSTTDWSQLPVDSLGIASLRSRLSNLLYQHIKQELPGLRKELDAIYKHTDSQLAKLGESRATVQQQRQYLTGLSIHFHDLTRSAANGLYDHAYFNSSQVRAYAMVDNPNRLCALVASCGLDFSDIMNKHGHKYSFNNRIAFGASNNIIRSVKVGSEDVIIDQIGLGPNESMALVKRVLANNRGTELPGCFNPRLIGELYQIQSQNWGKLAVHHIAHIAAVCEAFCNALRNHLAPRRTSNGYLDNVIEEALAKRVGAAKEELSKILEDEKCPPLTFNHYYTLTIQKSRLVKRKRTSTDIDGPTGTPNEKRAKNATQAPQFGMPGGVSAFGGRNDGASPSQVVNQNKIPIAVENEKGDIVFEDWEAESETRMILMDMVSIWRPP